MQLQPLPRKRIEKTSDLRIRKHPVQFASRAFRGVKLPTASRRKQLFVRHRAPEKVREATGKFKVIDLFAILLRGALFQADEAARDQYTRQG